MSEKFIIIGKIISAHGNKGEVKVKPLTEKIERFQRLKNISINRKSYEVINVREVKEHILLKLSGMNEIEDTKTVIGQFIEINQREAIKLPVNSYFIHEIIGLDVYLEDSSGYLGTVKDIIKTGSNDVYIVKNKENKEILVPAIKEIVRKIDIKNRKIFIRYIEGLL